MSHRDDKFADSMLREELRRLNAHLPTSRRLARELLAEDNPSVPTVDGGIIVMRRDEVETMASLLPEDVRNRIRLPMVFLRRTELGAGAFVLLGDKVEEFAIAYILGTYQGIYEDFKRQSSQQEIFYKPQISDLLRRFHSLVIMGFGPPPDLSR